MICVGSLVVSLTSLGAASLRPLGRKIWFGSSTLVQASRELQFVFGPGVQVLTVCERALKQGNPSLRQFFAIAATSLRGLGDNLLVLPVALVQPVGLVIPARAVPGFYQGAF